MSTQAISRHGGLDRVVRGVQAVAAMAVAAFNDYRARVQASNEEARIMAIARTDSRLMADLRAAKLRSEMEGR